MEMAHLAGEVSAPPWTRHAYAWLYFRLADEARQGLMVPEEVPVGPPSNFFPVLLATAEGKGDLGFVEVTYASEPPTLGKKDIERAAQGAASAVGNWFRHLDHRTEWPRISLHAGPGADGASAGLSAFILTLFWKLQVPVTERWCASGTWIVTRNRLEPVGPDTLPAKLAKALEWGYRDLLVIEGQAGVPPHCGLRVRYLPADPVHAALELAKGFSAVADGEPLAKLLAVFDRFAVRTAADERALGRVLAATGDFTHSSMPRLVRHFAHDIRSRAYLHAGRTEEAEVERGRSERDQPDLLPDGWLGDCLSWHRVAHHAVIAIDQGRWADEEPENRRVDEIISQLAVLPRRFSTLLASLYLCNTRARRREYLGRIGEDASLLALSWEDRTRFRSHWSSLIEYAQRLGLTEGDMRFQHNQCMDVVASYWLLTGKWPLDWGVDNVVFWPDEESEPQKRWGSFGLSAFLRWHKLKGKDVPENMVQRVLSLASVFFRKAGGAYPSYLPFEVCLMYEIGTEDLRRYAAELLVQSELFSTSLSDRSILSLLAIRAERLARRYLSSAPMPVRPAPGTALSGLAERLLSIPERIVIRCPY
ncbi:MAG: hypothetical protein NTY65_04690 [Planctomycetota bacterium]|nr:hypothetical protein [Planctomycetota bacterium]